MTEENRMFGLRLRNRLKPHGGNLWAQSNFDGKEYPVVCKHPSYYHTGYYEIWCSQNGPDGQYRHLTLPVKEWTAEHFVKLEKLFLAFLKMPWAEEAV